VKPYSEKEILELPAFLTVEEAAKILRLKRSTAYEYVRRGDIPSVRFGRFIRVPKAKILEMAGIEEKGSGAEKIITVPARPERR